MQTNLLAQNFTSIIGSSGSVGLASIYLGGIPYIFSVVIPYVIFGSAFLLLIYLVTGGLQLMLAKGDPKAMAGAWGKITNAVIGFVIVLLAYFATSLFAQIFGLNGFGGVFK